MDRRTLLASAAAEMPTMRRERRQHYCDRPANVTIGGLQGASDVGTAAGGTGVRAVLANCARRKRTLGCRISRDGLLNLVEPALRRLLIGPPTHQHGAMPKSMPGHMVEPDFDDEFKL